MWTQGFKYCIHANVIIGIVYVKALKCTFVVSVHTQELCVSSFPVFVFKCYTKLDRLNFVAVLLFENPVWFHTAKHQIILVFSNH